MSTSSEGTVGGHGARATRTGLAALAGILAAAGLVGELFARAEAQGVVGGRPYVSTLVGSSRNVDIVLSYGDGQAFDAIARDPTLSRPEVFYQGPDELAYRAQRPLVSYVSWLLALGHPAWTAAALMVVVVLSAGAAAAVTALLAGADRWWAGLVLILAPGTLASINGLESEPFAYSLAALGVLLWFRGRAWPAAAAFAAAALTRETTLLIPTVVAVHALALRPRNPRALVLPTIAGASWVAWVIVVRARVGAWPFDAGSGRLGAPFRGLAAAVPAWGADDIVVALVTAGLVVAALARDRGSALAWIVAAHALVAMLFGSEVWGTWENYSRPLLPLYGFAVVLLVRARGATGRVGVRPSWA